MRVFAYNGYSAFADVLPVVATEYNKAMNATETAVREAIVKLRVTAAAKTFFDYFMLGPWRGLATSEVPSAISTYLSTIETRAKQLTASRANVIGGSLSLEKWVASERVLIDGMDDLAKYLGQGDVTTRAANVASGALVAATRAVDAAVAKAKEIMAKAGDVGDTLKFWAPIAAVGAVLIGGVAAWKVLFR